MHGIDFDVLFEHLIHCRIRRLDNHVILCLLIYLNCIKFILWRHEFLFHLHACQTFYFPRTGKGTFFELSDTIFRRGLTCNWIERLEKSKIWKVLKLENLKWHLKELSWKLRAVVGKASEIWRMTIAVVKF